MQTRAGQPRKTAKGTKSKLSRWPLLLPPCDSYLFLRILRLFAAIQKGPMTLGRIGTGCGAILLATLLCGCLQPKYELTLKADGSGKIRLEMRTRIPPEMLSAMNTQIDMGGNDAVLYPPISEVEAKRFFPSKAFTVTTKEEKAGEQRILVIEAAFKDVNALLNSPYARAHALSLKIDAGKLQLKALSAIEAAAWFADAKDDGGMFGGEFAGLANLQ